MVANLCLVTCALLAAQSAENPEWSLFPRLNRGQELVYRGSFSEEAVGRGVQFNRTYRLENRVFILETLPRGPDVALYTVLRLRPTRSERGDEPEPHSVRLELVQADLHGHLRPDPGVSLAVPLDGPATVECEAFVEVPRGRVSLNQTWEILEPNRPAQSWTVVGIEVVNGTRCLKLKGIQKSPDWDRPRADSTAWRRQDLVWIMQSLGVAYKVERTIERRDPAHQEPTQRSVVQYELQSNLQYPGRLFDDRRREIMQARNSYAAVAPLLGEPTKSGPGPFDAVLAKITNHLDNQPATPYRHAVLQVQRQVQAAKRGESPPTPVRDNGQAGAFGLAVGQHAPDFIASNLLTRETAKLRRWLGQPILMIFYSPNSLSAAEVLKYAQKFQDTHHGRLAVLGFVVTDEVANTKKQYDELQLSFPVLAGQGLRQTYAVEATPKLLVIDADGIIRGAYVGWGPETPGTITEELNRWSRREAKE